MANLNVQKPLGDKPKGRRPRPNYNYVHRNLLPVEVHPLPPLIPHNPLSVVAIALTYLAQVLAPPQRPTYKGYFSSTTSSVHVTDPKTVRALWEMGFFGRGSLSRSEPTWLDSQQKIGSTAEEVTGKRREDRRSQKLQRAKLEQQEIAKQLSQESHGSQLVSIHERDAGATRQEGNYASGLEESPEDIKKTPTDSVSQSADLSAWKHAIEMNGLPTPPPTTTSSETDQAESRPIKKLQRSKSVRFSPTIEAREFDLSSPVISPIKGPGTSVVEEPPVAEASSEVENKEHLNLSLEEAFFLNYATGALTIYCEDTETILPPLSLLSLFRRHSYHPSRSLSAPVEVDDPFMISYAVYHHYRSLGWVVRSGVKFATDFLLYNRGPAFSHAEFAVIVIPSYGHKYWNDTTTGNPKAAKQSQKSWSWLHGVNRVQAQVHKQLVLCYVEIPPPMRKHEGGHTDDIGQELARYKVRDIGLRRWTPNRSRD